MQEMKDLASLRCKAAFIPPWPPWPRSPLEAGVSEATVSRVLNSKPGVSEATRQSVITALDVLGYERPDPPAAAQRRPRRPGRARAGEPDLPGLRAGHRGRAGAPPVHPGAVHPVARQPLGGRVRRVAARPRRRRHHLRLRQARRHPRRPRALPDAARPRDCRSSSSTGTSRASTAPFISADDRVAMDIAVAHLAQLGHRRIGLAIGPSRFMPSARKHEGFVAALGTHLGLAADRGPLAGSPRPSSPSRGARPPPSSCSSRARRPSSAART